MMMVTYLLIVAVWYVFEFVVNIDRIDHYGFLVIMGIFAVYLLTIVISWNQGSQTIEAKKIEFLNFK